MNLDELIQENKRLKERNNELESTLKNIASNLYFFNDSLKNDLWDNIISKEPINSRAKNISKLYFYYGKVIINILIDGIVKKSVGYCDDSKAIYTKEELEQSQELLKKEAIKIFNENKNDYMKYEIRKRNIFGHKISL